MSTRLSRSIILFLLLALLLSGCARQEPAVVAIDPNTHASDSPVVPTAPAPTPSPADVLDVTSRFLEWYLGYAVVDEYGSPVPPFEDGAHRTSSLLTPAYIARINQIVAVPAEQRGLFDPVLNGWGPAGNSTYTVFSNTGEAASVIATLAGEDWERQITLDLVNSPAGWQIDGIRGASIAAPEGVTQLFYEWYLDYYKSHGDPLADGAYKSSPYLSAAYIDWVNGVQTEFDNDGFDPFVMTRTIPTGFAIDATTVSGDQAVVLVRRFLMTSQPNPLVVHLEQQDGSWKIVDVTMEEAPAVPAEVVEAFYEWYLDYTGDPASGAFRNALVDGAYHGSPFLTPEYVAQVDATLAGMQQGGFDPFVCAQSVPGQITTDGTFLVEMYGPQFSNQASVIVRTDFAGHVFTVDLVRPAQGEDWKINNITCAGTPEGTVKAFYTWYMGCHEEAVACRQPEESYITSGFVTPAFAERVESLRQSIRQADVGGFDPFVMAQDTIPAFRLETLSETESSAQVLLTNTAYEQHRLVVSLVQEGAFWMIDGVDHYTPNTPEDITRAFFDLYAIRLRYPDDPGAGYRFKPELYLSPEFMQAAAGTLAAGTLDGYNPILLAEKLPERFEIEPALVNGERAVVVVARYFTGEAEPTSISVDLAQIDGLWRITGVR